MKSLKIFISIASLVFLSNCAHKAPTPGQESSHVSEQGSHPNDCPMHSVQPYEPDSNMGTFKPLPPRDAAALKDQREKYNHGGEHNFNAATQHGINILETDNKNTFLTELRSKEPKDPKAISENYEYKTNQEDILARHTFVLAGDDRKIGHHVAFFESRHQHHAIVRLELDFTGAGLKPGAISAADLKAGKELFENKILKEGLGKVPSLPSGEYYAVQVSPLNPEFELVTIPTGLTKTFLGSLATITSAGKVTRFNQKGADVLVKITGVHHFSRLYVQESTDKLRYLAFSANASDNKSKIILAHLIHGSLKDVGSNGELNIEQMLEATVVEPSDLEVKDGSVLDFDGRAANAVLKTGEEAEASLLKENGERVSVKLKIGKTSYFRPLGIDAGQDAIRKKLRGK